MPNSVNGDPETLWEYVRRHERDLYRGNGKPGLTLRMQSVEECQDQQEIDMAEVKKTMETTRKQLWAMIMLGLSTLTGVIVILIGHR